MVRKLDDFIVKRGGSIDPYKFKNEIFELLSIPAFDQGSPEILAGESIGSVKKVVAPNDILLSKIVPHIRRCWVVPKSRGYRQIASGEWIQFRSDELVPDYLRHFLISDPFHSQFMKTVKGVGGSLLRASPAQVAKVEIPLPPIDVQKRIAHLLGEVEGLIARRKQHLQQLDDLLKSVFLEMFGPKAPGYPDWLLVEIKDLAANHKGAMRTGPFGSNLLHSEFTSEGDVAVLGIDNAVQNRFAWGERRFITYKKYQELESYRIYSGDVIVTIMGTIGRSAVIPDNIPLAVNTKHLAAITLNKEIANPLFVSYSIHSSPFILNQFRSKNRGAIMSGLNLGIIKETKLKHPPVVLQNKFAAIHERIDEVKSLYQQSLTDLEALYGALSQKAFKGELDLSRVPMPADAPDKGGDEPSQPEITAHDNLDMIRRFSTLDTPAMSVKDMRCRLLQQWFDEWVGGATANEELSPESFWERARISALDYRGEDDEMEGFAAEDYDYFKEKLFSAIEDGLISQTCDTVEVGGKADLGNRIILKRAD